MSPAIPRGVDLDLETAKEFIRRVERWAWIMAEPFSAVMLMATGGGLYLSKGQAWISILLSLVGFHQLCAVVSRRKAWRVCAFLATHAAYASCLGVALMSWPVAVFLLAMAVLTSAGTIRLRANGSE